MGMPMSALNEKSIEADATGALPGIDRISQT